MRNRAGEAHLFSIRREKCLPIITAEAVPARNRAVPATLNPAL